MTARKPPSDEAHDRICEIAQKRLSPFGAELELWRRRFRHEARNNLYFLCKEVLNYQELTTQFHHPMCRRLDYHRWPTRPGTKEWMMYMLDMWPRGGFKTTIGTKGRGIQTVINNPEETILIGHGEKVKAERILSEIKVHFESNEFLRWLFPDIIWRDPKSEASKHGGEWSKDAITLKRKGTYSEPTFAYTSAESDETGGHYTLMLLDDMVTRKNSRTPEGRQKVYDFIMSMLFLRDRRYFQEGHPHRWPWMKGVVEAPFRAGMVATRWHYDDANSRMLKDEAFNGDLDWFIQKAIQDDGTSFFPERFPLDELARMKKKLTAFVFNSQMQQDPSYEKETIFPEQDVRNYSPRTLPQNLACFLACDPNNDADTENPCNGCVQTWGVDIFNNRYLLRNDVGRFSGTQLINIVVEHVIQFNPRRSKIEAANFQSQLVGMINERLKANGIKHRVEKQTRGGRGDMGKDERIMELQPLWGQGMIWVNNQDKTHQSFVDEATDFPHGMKDQLDTAQMANDIAVRPKADRNEVRRMVEAEQRERDKEKNKNEVTGEALLDNLKVKRKPKASRKNKRLIAVMRRELNRRTRA